MLQSTANLDRFSSDDIVAYREAWSQPGAWTATINWYRAALQKLPDEVPDHTIRAKTLVIWGKQDVALGDEMAQPSVDLCVDGRLEFLENASHWVQHDEPERVNQLILNFIRKPGY